ncbi:hypothetical protein E5161_19365 [Cohnella pontilimi]|uniref:Sporulation protein n=1 Tax=Cohnella pontilimi TaxID=2564100 RepID=A0A4U0F360_9BACL|nr:hypothetical protein [Cohnella pontilimi]TJY38987.1 hypothetical protein E5161_19365 [Cohnella pontilimi]
MRKQRKRGRSRLAALMALVMLLTLAAGCNAGRTSYGENNPQGANGDDNVSAKGQRYPDDGYLGTTYSYPSIPGHRRTVGVRTQTNSMRDAIRDINGVAGANITYQGNDAFVTVNLHPDVQPMDRPRIERQVASVLRFNFPRYTIHVTSTR